MSIKKSLETLKKQLNTDDVTIIAVTKYATVEQMTEVFDLGICDFGESKVQVYQEKLQRLPSELVQKAKWHYIGHLQTNKVNKVVGSFEYIHSVDSIKLGQAISKAAEKMNLTQKVLLEVNISGEENKYGFSRKSLHEQFDQLKEMNNITIVGLMTMAPYTQVESEIREAFVGLRTLRDELQETFQVMLPELSMGMSNDYLVAVEEGSTMVRIGRMLFA